MKTSICVGSGMCCKTAPCGFGEWLESEHKCKFLTEQLKDNDVVIYGCGNYDFIVTQPGHEWMPAFGSGCCMGLFNEARQSIFKEVRNGNEKIISFLKERLDF